MDIGGERGRDERCGRFENGRLSNTGGHEAPEHCVFHTEKRRQSRHCPESQVMDDITLLGPLFPIWVRIHAPPGWEPEPAVTGVPRLGSNDGESRNARTTVHSAIVVMGRLNGLFGGIVQCSITRTADESAEALGCMNSGTVGIGRKQYAM